MAKKKNTKFDFTKISKTLPVKKILFSANFFYFLLLLGFCLTTNYNAEILGKYTSGYFSRLNFLALLVIPYNLIILFLIKDSLSLEINNKKYQITFPWRFLIIIGILCFAFLFTESYLRAKPKPFIENFHPFLQYITTKKYDGGMHVNSDSFRYDELSKEKPENTYRIFLLGGSTVYDKDRPYEKSISKVVEEKLRKKYPDKNIQVINAGYERYTSEHSLIVYETKILDFDPDMIVIWQGFNDMYYSCNPSFTPIKEYKNDYSHLYQVISNPIDEYFNWKPIKFITIQRVIKAFSENFYADLRNRLPQPKNKIKYTNNLEFKSLDAYERNMNAIVKLAKADDVKVIVGNQPNHYDNNPKNYGLMNYFCKKSNTEYLSPQIINKGMKAFNDISKKVAENNEVPFVDLEKQLPKNSKYFYDDVHYTDIGDKKVADTVYESIVNTNYLSE